MSTNKTTNYQLHSWVAGDKFLRAEVNENFNKLDTAVPRVSAGSYVGDGTQERVIELGFEPQIVLVFNSNGQSSNGYTMYGGMAVPGAPVLYSGTAVLQVTSQGFAVRYQKMGGSYTISSNGGGAVYQYLAVG